MPDKVRTDHLSY